MTIYKSTNFQVDFKQCQNHVLLTHRIFNKSLYTEKLPLTVNLLKKHLPTIFENECFNDRRVSFAIEVCSTEVAHLFEHIILEKLKLVFVEEFGEADFSGETSWDWDRDEYGTFQIEINSTRAHSEIFLRVLQEATLLLDLIYQEHETVLNLPPDRAGFSAPALHS